MSDTGAIVYDGQFPYWEWLDLDSLEYITPNPYAVTWNSLWTWNWVSTIDISQWTTTDEIYAFGYNWSNILVKYRDWSTVLTQASTTTSLNVVLYNNMVIWASNPWKELTLSKIDIADVSDDSIWTTSTASFKTWNTTDYVTNEIKMLVWNNTLLVWYGRSLYRLNISDTWEELVSDFNDDIVWLTSANTFVRVYLRNWQVLTYDWASDNVDYTTNLSIWMIKDVFGVRWTDYVVTKTNQLLVSNWLDYEKLKWDKNYSAIDGTATKFHFEWWNSSAWSGSMIEYMWRIFYITGDSISSWGSLENWMPNAFNKDIIPIYTDWWIDWVITQIQWLSKSRDWDQLHFICKGTHDWSNINILYSYKKDKSTSAGNLAQIYSPKLLFGRVKRVWFELYVRADVTETDYITIYYKINWWSWVEWDTIDDDTRKTFILNSSLEFNEIEYWFKMVWSPKLYEYEFNPLPMQREWQT